MKNILNVNKISLKSVLMSLIILFGIFSTFNVKIACASMESQNGSSKDNNVNNNENIDGGLFYGALLLHYMDLQDQILSSSNSNNDNLELTEDMIKTIRDLANNNKE